MITQTQDVLGNPAIDTRDQELNYANNIKWNTNHNQLLTKTITLVSNRSI